MSPAFRRLALTLAVLLLGALAARTGLDSLRTSDASAAGIEASAAAVEAQVAAAAADPAAQQAQLARLTAAVPPEADLPGVLDALAGAARATGVTWTSATPGPATRPRPGLTAYTITGQVTGSTASVQAWLAALARLPRLVVVDTVQLSADQTGTTAGTTASITARFFTTAAPGPGAGATQ